ncbi:MAG: hypothetical protein ABI960_08505, partial [Candidatus Eisenbacteria bacterium]
EAKPTDPDAIPPHAARAALVHHGLRAALFAQAVVGALLGLAAALVIPALQFRLDAARDAKAFTVLAVLATLLAALEAGLVAAWSARRLQGAGRALAPVGRVRRRDLACAFLLPIAFTLLCVRAQAALIEREDPLLTYVERGLARRLAQRGIGSAASLEVADGKLTLVVPTYLARRAAWSVEVDAGDTEGRQSALRARAAFGADPVILRVPLPLRSEEMQDRDFMLVPGSIVVVRSIRFVADAADPAIRAGHPAEFSRRLDLVYEVPPLARGARSRVDFVSAPTRPPAAQRTPAQR